jgi:WD40 repeat protein
VAGYEILSELGRGGMGVVYLARQLSLKRLVALKMVLAGSHAGSAELVRFRTEAEAAARLQHPNIVQIYEVGQQDGLPFFSLEYVDGGSLARALAGTPLPPGRAAQLIETLARAMHYAHQRGIVHRDLKPANVLLTADGLPKITDFGLAKQLDDAAVHTQSGAVLGTPSYMAPEQAGGQTHDIGPAADVYALGAVLYELLTGRPPFKAATPLDTLMQVLTEEPVPPRQLQPKVPRDLETICLKCLEKDPRKRYAGALALADDLRRCASGEPIAARPVGLGGRTLKWVRRRPAVAGLLALVVAFAAAGFALVTWKWQDARLAWQEATDKAEAAARALALVAEKERLTQAALEDAEAALYFNHVTQADLEWRAGNGARAELILDQCRLDQRRWEWRYLKRLCQGVSARAYRPASAALGVAFSPDGTHLAWAGADHTVTVRNLGRGKEVRTLRGHEGAVSMVAFHPDGRHLVSASADRTLKLWDLTTGQPVRTFRGLPDPVTSLALSPRGRRLAAGSNNFAAFVWDVGTGKQLFTLAEGAGAVPSVAFSPDGKRIATASHDTTVKIWDAATGQRLLTFHGHKRPVEQVVFCPDNRHAASLDEDGRVKCWDAATGAEVFTQRGVDGALVLSPDGRRLAGAAAGGVKFWDTRTGREALSLTLPAAAKVHGLAFSPRGRFLAAAWSGPGKAGPGEVRVWDAAPLPEVFTLRGQSGPVASVAFSADGKQLAAAGLGAGTAAGEIQVWDTATARELRALAGHLKGVTGVAYSPDGKYLATCSEDSTLMVWDAATGKNTLILIGDAPHTAAVRGIAIRPGGKNLASASADRTVKLWDVTAIQDNPVRTLRGHTAGVNGVAFSTDGKYLASAGDDRAVILWEVDTGKKVHSFPGHRGPVLGVAFSPDGKWLASASADLTVIVWDLATRQSRRSLNGHSGAVQAVAFSSDSRHLASAGADGFVKVWDVQTGKAVFSHKAHTAPATGVAFSPVGNYLATGGRDAVVKVWDAKRWAEKRGK